MMGWIKLWRKILDNPALDEHDALGVFVRLLLLAQHQDKRTFCKKIGAMIDLKRGQLWLSVRELATKKFKYQQIRTIIKRLQAAEIISLETNAGITVVTICNYSEYQGIDDPANAAFIEEIMPSLATHGLTQTPTQNPTQEENYGNCVANAGETALTHCEKKINLEVDCDANAGNNAGQTDLLTQNVNGRQHDTNEQEQESKNLRIKNQTPDSEPRESLLSPGSDQWGHGPFPKLEKLPMKNGNRIYPTPFEHFWFVYPTRDSDTKAKAYKAWLKPANNQHIGCKRLYVAATRVAQWVAQDNEPSLISVWVNAEGWTAVLQTEDACLNGLAANGSDDNGNVHQTNGTTGASHANGPSRTTDRREPASINTAIAEYLADDAEDPRHGGWAD